MRRQNFTFSKLARPIIDLNKLSYRISTIFAFLFQMAASDPNRPTNCMRFSATRSQTLHSMSSSAITKSASSPRLSHRPTSITQPTEEAIPVVGDSSAENLKATISPVCPNAGNGDVAITDEPQATIVNPNPESNETNGNNSSSNSSLNLNIIASPSIDPDFLKTVVESYSKH